MPFHGFTGFCCMRFECAYIQTGVEYRLADLGRICIGNYSQFCSKDTQFDSHPTENDKILWSAAIICESYFANWRWLWWTPYAWWYEWRLEVVSVTRGQSNLAWFSRYEFAWSSIYIPYSKELLHFRTNTLTTPVASEWNTLVNQ